MRRWFLSYHSPDQALAERLKTALERRDSDARVFFAPSSLRAGGFWSRTLAEEIAQADAFILLVGERGVGDWQVLEYDEALDKRVKSPDFPLILVLLEGQTAPGLPFLRRLHWIITSDPSSEKDVARLFDAASGTGERPGALWRYTSPYRGLTAMEEKDSDYFFGREEKTVEVIKSLATASRQLAILLGNSGVGKSSVAQAGVLAALKRQAWPERVDVSLGWPDAFRESRRWCFLPLKPGTEPVRALVEPFLWTWQFDAVDPRRAELLSTWVGKLIDGTVTLRDLLDATEARYRDVLHQPKPPAFLLYIDQGEELYVRAEARQRQRFSEVIAQGVSDPRLHMLMSMRSDFLGELQKDEPLFKIHRKIDVPPLREAELREVVSRPAEVLSARFETAELADIITRRAAEDSVKDVGALPLLSYTLDDMWTQMVKRGDGELRLPAQSFELGGVLVSRADAFLSVHPESQNELRRIFTLKLATVRQGEEPTRRRAFRSEFTDEEWRLATELADHPNRLLITATPEGSETYAEVAHEAIFRRWGKLRDWIAAEREFLAWRTGLEANRRAWREAPHELKTDALLMGFALTQAVRWLGKRHEVIPRVDQDFIELSRQQARWQKMRTLVTAGVAVTAMLAGLGAWWKEQWLKEERYWFFHARGQLLTGDQERKWPTKKPFKECTHCPELVVVPAGVFSKGGSLAHEDSRVSEGLPQTVPIKRLAVAKYETTFEQWDACVKFGSCDPIPEDNGWGRGRRPVIGINWYAAKRYAEWLSKITGKPYRLLTEPEWEYAARSGTQTAYSWGEEIGRGNANCDGCGSKWDKKKTAPVGEFAPNDYGLFDMHGNVWEWVEDCAIPEDNSEQTADVAACKQHVLRGGAWDDSPQKARADYSGRLSAMNGGPDTGFRVGRTFPP